MFQLAITILEYCLYSTNMHAQNTNNDKESHWNLATVMFPLHWKLNRYTYARRPRALKIATW